MNEKLVFFVATPDSYSDIFEVFLSCFVRHCKNSPYKLIVANNTKHYNYDNVIVFNNNNPGDCWMDRAIPVLKKLNADYILYMDDDIFIMNDINFSNIEHIISDMIEFKINVCSLTNYIRGKKVKKESLINYVRKNKPYVRNLQAGIYKKDYLLSILGDGSKSGWQLEKEWNEISAKSDNKYYKDITSCQINVLQCIHGVMKGKWFPSVKKKITNLNISIGNRETLSRRTEIIYLISRKIAKKIPSRLRGLIKKILKYVGFSFETDY